MRALSSSTIQQARSRRAFAGLAGSCLGRLVGRLQRSQFLARNGQSFQATLRHGQPLL
ncbi:hypothetical protein ACQEVF_25685 [Nonomuraea polychroma]|uniref:hypothetical protein n=1 Tax=Nonomuraea polychroma TaxID=46176 RepID=UPI003D8C2E90